MPLACSALKLWIAGSLRTVYIARLHSLNRRSVCDGCRSRSAYSFYAFWAGPNAIMPTTDLRSVVKGILADNLGLPAHSLNAAVFPSSEKIAPTKGLIA